MAITLPDLTETQRRTMARTAPRSPAPPLEQALGLDRGPAQVQGEPPLVGEIREMKRQDLLPRKGRFGIPRTRRPAWWYSFRSDSENKGRADIPYGGDFDVNDPDLKFQFHDIDFAPPDSAGAARRRFNVVGLSAINTAPDAGVADFFGFQPKSLDDWRGFENGFWRNVKDGEVGTATLQAIDAGTDVAPVISALVLGLSGGSGALPLAVFSMAQATMSNIVKALPRPEKGRKIYLGMFPSAAVENIVSQTVKGRGLAVLLATGDAPPKGGIPRTTLPEGSPMAEQALQRFVENQLPRFKQDNMYLGTWLDPDNGAIYVDVSRRFRPDQLEEAAKEAKRAGEKALPIGRWQDFKAPPESGIAR